MKLSSVLGLAATFGGILLFPSDVFAWGPVAHLDFAFQILAGAAALSPSLLKLIRRHPFDFYYGSLAADAIIGKNRAEQHDHCHSWSVARELWKQTKNEGEDRRVFMLGYLSHLGADVVAHNYVVPQMLIVHFKKKGAGHLYWEARADQRLLGLNPELRKIWKELSQLRFPSHDSFLARNLVPTLMSNRLSAHLYRHGLNVQRTGPWTSTMSRLDRRSRLLFEQEDLLHWRRLAVDSTKRAMESPMSKRLGRLDPTGKRALKRAVLRRKALRRKSRHNKDVEGLEEMYMRAILAAKTVHINMFELD